MPALIPPMLLDGLPCWTPRLLWGPPFNFWGGVGEGRGLVWVISAKISLATNWFRGEKIIARKHLGKKYPTLKKKSYTFACQRKIYHQRFGKIIFTQTKSSYPPHKSNNRLLIQLSVVAPHQCGRLARRNVWRRGARKDGCISRLEFIPDALSANGSYCTLKHSLFFLTEIKVTTSILVAV